MSLYDDIVRSQVKQGNLGGKHGPLGSYAAKKQKAPKPAAKPKEKVKFTVSILDGKVYKSTDANGLSDPWVRICKTGLVGKTLCHTDVQSKTLEPKWNYNGTMTLSIPVNESVELSLEMLDKDMMGSDRVGVCKIKVGKGGLAQSSHQLYDASNNKMINADVTISITPSA